MPGKPGASVYDACFQHIINDLQKKLHGFDTAIVRFCAARTAK